MPTTDASNATIAELEVFAQMQHSIPIWIESLDFMVGKESRCEVFKIGYYNRVPGRPVRLYALTASDGNMIERADSCKRYFPKREKSAIIFSRFEIALKPAKLHGCLR